MRTSEGRFQPGMQRAGWWGLGFLPHPVPDSNTKREMSDVRAAGGETEFNKAIEERRERRDPQRSTERSRGAGRKQGKEQRFSERGPRTCRNSLERQVLGSSLVV